MSASQRISVIVPTRNEVAYLGPTLQRIFACRPHQVIVADAYSTDGTAAIAREAGAEVVQSPAGRAGQMRVAIERATGDALLFVHADTLLPSDYAGHVSRVLAEPGTAAGAFWFALDAQGPSMRLIERLTNWRASIWQMPYGDQALFITRRMYDAAGGFDDVPIMEDFLLVRRLRQLGRIGIAPAAAVTSARRWRRHGVWRTTLINQACVLGYTCGVPLSRIARWRDAGGRATPEHLSPPFTETAPPQS